MINEETKRMRNIFVGLYCFMILGLSFGTPPDFIQEKISLKEGIVGSTVAENAYPYRNGFSGLVSNYGLILTILFYGGLFTLGLQISEGLGEVNNKDSKNINQEELVNV